MTTAARAGTPHNLLRRLATLGACLECRGDKIVLRAGAQPVPATLVQAAREAKAELSKMLNQPQVFNNDEGEHLRHADAENSSISTDSTEDAQRMESEHLRENVSASDESNDFPAVPGDQAPKALIEDAHLSAFDEGKDFCGFRPDRASKALNRLQVSTLVSDERLRGVPRAWAEGFAHLDPCQPPGDVPTNRWQRFIDDAGLFLDSGFCAVAVSFGWEPLDLFGCNRKLPFARIDEAGLLWLLNGGKLVALSEDAAAIETSAGARLTYRRTPSGPSRVLAWELERFAK